LTLISYWRKRRGRRYSIYRRRSVAKLVFLLAVVLFIMWLLGRSAAR